MFTWGSKYLFGVSLAAFVGAVAYGLITGGDPVGVLIDTLDIDSVGRQIAPLAVELGLRLTEVTPLDDDLESVFRYLVEGR